MATYLHTSVTQPQSNIKEIKNQKKIAQNNTKKTRKGLTGNPSLDLRTSLSLMATLTDGPDPPSLKALETWGHQICNKQPNTIRILLQNIRGIDTHKRGWWN